MCRSTGWPGYADFLITGNPTQLYGSCEPEPASSDGPRPPTPQSGHPPRRPGGDRGQDAVGSSHRPHEGLALTNSSGWVGGRSAARSRPEPPRISQNSYRFLQGSGSATIARITMLTWERSVKQGCAATVRHNSLSNEDEQLWLIREKKTKARGNNRKKLSSIQRKNEKRKGKRRNSRPLRGGL